MALGVLLALTGSIEERWVRTITATSGMAVTRRCADLEELLAAALAGLGTVAVTGAEEVDRTVVDRLERAGVRLVVVAPVGDHQRLESLGALPTVPDADLVSMVRLAHSDAPAVTDEQLAQLAGATVAEQQPQVPGSMIAVWGADGSPGRSTLAINLAAELARGGEQVLLIDADIWGSALAQMLGMLEDSAGLATAIRSADHGTCDGAAVARIASDVAPGLRLLSGIPRAERWREVSAGSLQAVLQAARSLARWVVIDAPTLVPDDDTAYEPLAGAGRNQVLLTVLEHADDVLVVGAAEPVGIERLVQVVLDSDDLPGARSRTVVVNRVRDSAAGSRPGASVREALARFAGVTDAVLIPDDRPTCDKALLSAQTWAESSPRSAALAAVRTLVARLGGSAATPARRGRKRPV